MQKHNNPFSSLDTHICKDTLTTDNYTYYERRPLLGETPDECVKVYVSLYMQLMVYQITDAGKSWSRATQPIVDPLLNSTTSIHFITMVEFRWYKIYRGGRIY